MSGGDVFCGWRIVENKVLVPLVRMQVVGSGVGKVGGNIPVDDRAHPLLGIACPSFYFLQRHLIRIARVHKSFSTDLCCSVHPLSWRSGCESKPKCLYCGSGINSNHL